MRKLLFSVTAADCDWKFQRGSGHGGQAKNKTNNAVICTHRASNAQGYAEDTRSREQNRKLAFERMAATQVFKTWLEVEYRRRTGQQAAIEETVNREMNRIRVDVKEDGLWKEVNKEDPLHDS